MAFGESKLSVCYRQACHEPRGAFMRVGKYESSEGNAAGTAITFLLIGLGAGTLIGLLFAPKAGKQMRKELRRKYEDARETLDDWKDEAKEVAEDALERGQELADELRDKVAPLTAAMKRR
jgi:gas vesicle protein